MSRADIPQLYIVNNVLTDQLSLVSNPSSTIHLIVQFALIVLSHVGSNKVNIIMGLRGQYFWHIVYSVYL